MTTRSQAFGYASPFGAPVRQGRRAQAPQPQQQEFYQDEEEFDPQWETQGYLKIGLRMRGGAVKFLRFGKTDKTLREGSPLEAMILDYVRQGRDLNELAKLIVLEVNLVDHDPAPMEFDFDLGEPEEEAFDTEPAPQVTKPSKPRQRRTSEE